MGKAQSSPRTEKRYGPLGRIVQRSYYRVGRRDQVIRCEQECRDRRTLERLVGVIPSRKWHLRKRELEVILSHRLGYKSKTGV